MKNIIRLSLIFLTGTLLFACDQDFERTIIDPEYRIGVGFSQTSQSFEVSPKEAAPEVFVQLGRADISKEGTYNLSLTNNSGIGVQIPASVTFKAGEGVIMLPVAITTADMEVGETYSFDISLPDQNNYLANDTLGDPYAGIRPSMRVSVGLEITWIEAGVGVFTSNFAYGASYQVALEQGEGTSTYRLLDLLEDDYHFQFKVESDGTLTFAQQNTGLAYDSENDIYIRQHPSMPTSNRNGNTFNFYFQYVIPGAGLAYNYSGLETFILN